MKVFFLFLSLALARSSSYQRCISAVANMENYQGGDSIELIFPGNYDEHELRQTIDDLGNLVYGFQLEYDVRRLNEEKNKEDMLKIEALHKELIGLRGECVKAETTLSKAINFVMNRPLPSNCVNFATLETRRQELIANVAIRRQAVYYGNRIKLRVF
jgi:hypothetical protein